MKTWLIVWRITLIGVFSLIFIGAMVRSTGSGMGCPDWPKCFGSWIPPIYESQLPADYHTRYAQVGYATMAFDPIKTWIEYFNRLFGVSVGLMAIALFASSFYALKKRPWVTIWSGIALLLVIFQGALGALVVKSNLHPLIITAHMVLAMALLLTLSQARHASLETVRVQPVPSGFSTLLRFGFWLLVLQMLLGTQVRQGIDLLMAQEIPRTQWVYHLGVLFFSHRSLSWLLLMIGGSTVWSLRHVQRVRFHLFAIIALLSLEFLLGICMVYFAFPKWAQPLHLLGASALVWTYWETFLAVRKNSAP